MGFALMLERADALRADPGFHRIYARRLGVLLLIGLVHANLIWAGDILVPYALGGFILLLLFRNTPVPQLRVLGIVFYFIPLCLLWSGAGMYALAQFDPAAAAGLQADASASEAEFKTAYLQAEAVYRDGSYVEVVQQRVRDSLMQYGWTPMFLPSVLGMFVLGAWFVRSGVMRAPERHRRLWLGLLGLGGPIGVLLVVPAQQYLEQASLVVPTLGLATATSAMMAGSLLLCLAYAAGVILAVLGPAPWLRNWLAPVGRSALSNYLLQSIVFSTLFYGYGFGLWGQISRLEQLLLVLAVFVLQIALSRWWLERFRYGPVEWLWRSATYGRREPMRRAALEVDPRD
jgi:uncharacterized protein